MLIKQFSLYFLFFFFFGLTTNTNGWDGLHNLDEIPKGFTLYFVKQNDTLSKIAPEEHWDIIKRINRIDEKHLPVQKNILIPTDITLAKSYLPVSSVYTIQETERFVVIYTDIQYFGVY